MREERELEKLIEETVEEFDPLEGKNLKQLDKLAKESEEYSDDRILEEYRKKRIEALQKKQKEAKFGNGVKHIKKSDFVREVTDASQNNWVVLHLFKEPHDECAVLGRCLEVLARSSPEEARGLLHCFAGASAFYLSLPIARDPGPFTLWGRPR